MHRTALINLSRISLCWQKEDCRTIVLETQELIKKLTKPELKKMTDQLAEQANACVSTSGAPLSMLAHEAWPKCLVDFFYGDELPNMKERGEKGKQTVFVFLEDLFLWLQDREGTGVTSLVRCMFVQSAHSESV